MESISSCLKNSNLRAEDIDIVSLNTNPSSNIINKIPYFIKNYLTGNKKNNPLSRLGDLNLWVDSNVYNHIENTHQVWLLSVCDLINLNKVK